jgi:tetratricopeptide (TPR) repeat protein
MALRELIETPVEPHLQLLALQALANSKIQDKDPSFFEGFLGPKIQQKQSNSAVLEWMYVFKIQWLVAHGHHHAAESLGREYLDQYPQSAHKKSVLQALVYNAYSSWPPQYRIATDYLSKLAQDEPNPVDKKQLETLMAHCYFLNGDYEQAAKLYHSVLNETQTCISQGPLVLQYTLCQLAMGQTEKALGFLDTITDPQVLGSLYYWQAEWNTLITLRQKGMHAVALERLIAKIPAPTDTALLELRLRFLWLSALVASEIPEQYHQALGLVEQLLGETQQLPNASPELKKLREQLESQTHLIHAAVAYRLEDHRAALEAWSHIRTHYPQTPAASIAYLEEARFWGKQEQYVKSLHCYMELVDTGKEDSFAPTALYEAAIVNKKLAKFSNLEQSLLLLERMIQLYPQHDLVFFARMEQGDTLRIMHKLSAAQKVYEALLYEFPQHPWIHNAQLALGKTLLALGLQDNKTLLQEALLHFEHLSDRPQVDQSVRVEAAYHRAWAEAKVGNPDEAELLYWQLIQRFLPPSPTPSSAPARYWLARSIVDLKRLLEKRNAHEEAKAVYELLKTHQLPGYAP